MTQLNQMEVNSIREIVEAHQTTAAKLSDYSQQCQDAKIKQMFEQASKEAQQSCQKLIQML